MQTHPPSAARPSADPRQSNADGRRRRRRTPILIAIIVVLALGSIWWVNHRRAAAQGGPGGGGGGRGGGRFGGMNGPLPVTVQAAQKGDIAVNLNGLGTVTPAQVITVRSQVSGHLDQIGFKEGDFVHAGDLLAVIDPRPFEVALKQAQGQLAQAESQLRTAELDLERYETLAKEDSIAKQQVDTAKSQVNQFRGQTQVYQAAIDAANLNLTYCHIKAPIDGRVGLRQVDVGNYITPGDATGIVVLAQTKPITVVFTLPEDNMAAVAARLHGGADLPVTAIDRTQSRTLATGKLAAMDNQIDPATGTFKLRAEFANEDESLFPNQFVNVRLLLDTLHDVLVVPTSAVERGQSGSFVYVVQPDDTVAARDVKLGQTEGERVAVTSGLNPGDRIVTDGADKLKEGMKVIAHGPNEAAGAPGAWRKRNGGQGGANGAEGGQRKWKRPQSSEPSGSESPKQ
jgi:multidrug efflux system membrane fusion protein